MKGHGGQFKHRAIKKLKDEKRKSRKEENLMKAIGIKPKLKRDPGAPDLRKFKEKIVHQMEAEKETAEKKFKLNQLKQKDWNRRQNPKSMEQLAEEARAAGEEAKLRMQTLGGEEDKELKSVEKSKKHYFKELQKVVDQSDVILEVLDSRDPMGCRSKKMESYIVGKNKKLILVLNKIDLVPSAVAVKWRLFLRREFPTILFKANTQGQAEKLSDITLQPGKLEQNLKLFERITSSTKTVGGDNLMQLIKNYCRTGDVKASLTVGVIGIPNVGKSSLINSLKRSKVAATSSVPGFTKTIQEIYLDHNVRLLDCPGVVLSDENEDSVMLRNVMKVEDIVNPFVPIDILVQKVPKETLLQVYGIADFSSGSDFLCSVARKRGRLLKGGIPDTEQTARDVLRDWNNGKIPFFTECPIDCSEELSASMNDI